MTTKAELEQKIVEQQAMIMDKGKQVKALRAELQKATLNEPQEPKLEGLDFTLAERGSRYGDFAGHALITQLLKAVMTGTIASVITTLTPDQRHILDVQLGDSWYTLSVSHKEALEMIAHKIGRILNGDPNYDDSWIDVAGYAKLGEKECKNER